jgi:hypothetical protein
MNHGQTDRSDVSQVTWPDQEVAEISVLMPAWQTAQLLDLATSRRLTLGELLRGVVGTYLEQHGPMAVRSIAAGSPSSAFSVATGVATSDRPIDGRFGAWR